MSKKYKMHHSCIRVMDLDKSLEFYKEAFGFKVVTEKDFPKDRFTLVFLEDLTGNFSLELTYNYDQEEPYTIGNGYSHLAVAVSDVKDSYKYHQEEGFNIGDMHSLSEDSAGFYFITDPDGYDIEVIQR